MTSHELKELVLDAESRIRPYVRETILEHVPWLESYGAKVFCKLENLQYTGSFKLRGAINKILSLTSEERTRGVVAASTGNHGAAVAYSLKKLKVSGLVFVPENTPTEKVNAIERMETEVRRFGNDPVHTEIYAKQYAVKHNMIFVSPYNDMAVIAGQGTISVEICRQLDCIDVVFASLGGGGLLSGIAGYFKAVNPDIQIIGCSPENSQNMIRSIRAGRILDMESLPTLSDSTAGGIESGTITLGLCRNLINDYITTTETEISESILQFIRNQHMLIEGAAAVSVASYLKTAKQHARKNVVIVICGANITLDSLAHLFSQRMRV